jgi:hypothetical protein
MLTIYLPEDLENELSSLTNDKHTFIIDAIRIKIDLEKRTITSNQIFKEYSNFEKDKPQIGDFKNTGMEKWGDY